MLFHPQGTQQSTQIFHGSTKIDIFANGKLYYTDNGILGINIDILNSNLYSHYMIIFYGGILSLLRDVAMGPVPFISGAFYDLLSFNGQVNESGGIVGCEG